MDSQSTIFVGVIASVTLLILAGLYRGLVMETFDRSFLQVNNRLAPHLIHGVFLALLVLNLVAGFQILGTLMSVGLMMLPAVSARCWAKTLPGAMFIAIVCGLLSAWIGLAWSFAAALPAGPAIVLTASVGFFISILFGSRSGLVRSLCRGLITTSKGVK